jgi:hypothetical protein
MNPTFGDLVAFVLLNRSDKVFKGMSEETVAKLLYKKMQDKLLYYTTDEYNITGMIIATKHEEAKILFIDENLAMTMKNLKKFAARSKQDFPGYRLEWYKNNIHQFPDRDKIYAKLQ